MFFTVAHFNITLECGKLVLKKNSKAKIMRLSNRWNHLNGIFKMQIKCQNKGKLIERHHILNSNGKAMTLGEYLGSESATLCLPKSGSANIFNKNFLISERFFKFHQYAKK